MHTLLISVWPFAVSLLIALVSTPAIIKVAALKHLMDEPDTDRKLHSERTPTLGGISIFAATVFSFSFFNDYLGVRNEILFITPGIVLLFFAGIKDDILLLSPMKKLAVQMISALLITVLGKLYLTNLWGMFEINDITPWTGIPITFIAIVAVINAFNLIDGVNGLAGGLGLIASLFFGTWFFLTDASSLSILSFSLAGALLGFLYFNFHRGKIFMGDTGSMLIGFIISILAIKFVENNRANGMYLSPHYIRAAPGVAVATILIPLVDMVRVFFHRIICGKSPFNADRRHLHHIMLDLGMSQTIVSITLYFACVGFIALSLYLKDLRSMQLVLILTFIALSMTLALTIIKKIKLSKNRTPETI